MMENISFLMSSWKHQKLMFFNHPVQAKNMNSNPYYQTPSVISFVTEVLEQPGCETRVHNVMAVRE